MQRDRIEPIPQVGGQLGRFSAQFFHALGGVAQAVVKIFQTILWVAVPHVLAVSSRRANVVTSSVRRRRSCEAISAARGRRCAPDSNAALGFA